MGLANWLTVLRIVLTPVFVTFLVYRKPGVALVVFAVAALSTLFIAATFVAVFLADHFLDLSRVFEIGGGR